MCRVENGLVEKKYSKIDSFSFTFDAPFPPYANTPDQSGQISSISCLIPVVCLHLNRHCSNQHALRLINGTRN